MDDFEKRLAEAFETGDFATDKVRQARDEAAKAKEKAWRAFDDAIRTQIVPVLSATLRQLESMGWAGKVNPQEWPNTSAVLEVTKPGAQTPSYIKYYMVEPTNDMLSVNKVVMRGKSAMQAPLNPIRLTDVIHQRAQDDILTFLGEVMAAEV